MATATLAQLFLKLLGKINFFWPELMVNRILLLAPKRSRVASHHTFFISQQYLTINLTPIPFSIPLTFFSYVLLTEFRTKINFQWKDKIFAAHLRASKYLFMVWFGQNNSSVIT